MRGRKRTANPYRIEGDTAVLILTQGQETRIDVADLPRVVAYRWRAAWYPTLKGYYAQTRIGGRTTYLHRFVLTAPSGMTVDHRNHDPLDNRRANLRLVTHAQNLQNRAGAASNSPTGVRGVTVKQGHNGPRCYQARVVVMGKYTAQYFPFTSEGLAAATEAVLAMRRELMTHSDGR